MKVEVKTNEYEFSHGKKPKGTGRWAFFIDGDIGDVLRAYWFTGKYSEARKQAVAKARKLGIGIITVGS